ncbi:hypothetical protein [Streptomyces sp. NPDC056160]|uniref:hypothetical protein n=1 Tax=Streptomyces sp. NPDC056160 TaxID=3345731 RepID=UPI0035D561A9
MTGNEALQDSAGHGPVAEHPQWSPYQVRPIATAAEQAEAHALIEDRTCWLAKRNLHALPTATGLPADESNVTAIGMFEDDVLIGCLALHHNPSLLAITRAYGQFGADFARLATLWAADYAARCGVDAVRTVVIGPFAARHRLETHLTDLGWSLASHSEESAWLQLTAEARPTLTALIRCAVPLSENTHTLWSTP